MADKTPLRELKAKALETAHRFDVYSSYGGNEATAVRALVRRTQGLDKDEIGAWFRKALVVQRGARPWLRDNAAEVRALYLDERTLDFGEVAGSFHDAHAHWPKHELNSLLASNYVYFYLR